MSIETGFDSLQGAVNASPDAVKEARRRRDLFRSALNSMDDVLEVFPSGSLARGTHKDPIHDVDLVAVYDPAVHPEWGSPGPSAHDALEYARTMINGLLGAGGTVGEEVRFTLLKNHAVKCFLDDPDDSDAFTVDIAPALRRPEGGIFIPEDNNSQWVASDPEDLMTKVAKRHAEWGQFAKLVRVLKRWNADHGAVMKPLVVEVLALSYLPALDRPEALQRFFTAAAANIWTPVCDPAGLCGEIQPDLDKQAANAALSGAADLAWRAVDAAGRGETKKAMCLWRELFGPIYPEPLGGCDQISAVGAAAVAATAVRPKRPIRDAAQG